MKARTFKKIAIIGTGFVGSTTAYTLMISGLVSELALVDVNKSKAEGEAMDLNHGMPFVRPVKIYTGDYKDCKDADIVIISAGANQRPGETRIDLIHKNASIFRSIITELVRHNNDCILLVVTNPVDILTYFTYRLSGFPKNMVIGSGTVLDTARFKYMIGSHVGVDPRNINGYIIGEHGDTEVPAWSLTDIAGISMEKYCEQCGGCDDSAKKRDEIFYNVRNAAYQIIERKGATYYAVALAVRRIVESIVRNENSILTVSSLLEGQYGLRDVCLSIPSVVNSSGVERVLDVEFSQEEIELLKKSADTLKEVIKTLGI